MPDMPPLIPSEHPACAELINEYKECTQTTPLWSKVLTGACTSLKYKLDACFRQEKIDRSKRNLEQAKVRPFGA